MKTFLCILLLINYFSFNAATQDLLNSDETTNVNDNQKLTSDESSKDIPLDSSDLLIDNDSIGHSNTEEGLDEMEDTDSNSEEYDDETDVEDSDFDMTKMFEILEDEIYKRLAAIAKSFEGEENEQVSEESEGAGSSASDMADTEIVTQNNESAVGKTTIENFDIANAASKSVIKGSENVEKSESNTKKSITGNEDSDTESQMKNIKSSVFESGKTIKNSESETQSKDSDIKETQSKDSDIKDSESNDGTSANVAKVERTTENEKKDNKNTKSDIQNLRKNIEKSQPENSMTDLDNIESEAEDFDIDNYYDELLNSDLGNVETFEDFIGDDEDAYSVVDITLPSDTQFEMTKYEKMQNGRKVVLMKLVPVGSTPATDEDQSTKNKSLLIPVTNTVDSETSSNEDFDNNEKSTRDQNKKLISTDTSNESSPHINSDKVSDDTRENSNSRTTRNSETVSDENIAEDVDDFSTTVGSKNVRKSLAAEDDDGAKWCICYNKLADIPWVVRMQMGV